METILRDANGRFKPGISPMLGKKHSEKTKRGLSESRKGKGNPNWKGGIILHSNYVKILMPGHRRADKKGYVKRAILVWEQASGRELKKGEIVHHDDGNKLNDSPGNLYAMIKKEHDRLEGLRRGKKKRKLLTGPELASEYGSQRHCDELSSPSLSHRETTTQIPYQKNLSPPHCKPGL